MFKFSEILPTFIHFIYIPIMPSEINGRRVNFLKLTFLKLFVNAEIAAIDDLKYKF